MIITMTLMSVTITSHTPFRAMALTLPCSKSQARLQRQVAGNVRGPLIYSTVIMTYIQ